MSLEALGWAFTRNLRFYNKLPLIMLASRCGIGPEPEMIIHTDYNPDELARICGMTQEELHKCLRNLLDLKLIEIRDGSFNDWGEWVDELGSTAVLNVSKEHRI